MRHVVQKLREKALQPHNRNDDRRREEILFSRLQLAEEIYDLTLAQREAIASKDWERVKGVLDEKDKRIREFQRTEKSLVGWTPLGKDIDVDPQLKTISSRIQSKFEAIQSLEEACQRSLTAMKDQTAQTLQDIRHTREAIRRFRPRRPRVPRFVDLRR